MALDKQRLKVQLKQIFNNPSTVSNIDVVATQMAEAIDEFVRSGKVEIEQGIKVNTTGTAYAQQGTTIEKGIGKVI